MDQQSQPAPTLTPEQTAQLIQTKTHFPYRFVWARVKGDVFEIRTTYTRQPMLNSVKKGWTVFEVE